jgi:ferric-chelate reductase
MFIAITINGSSWIPDRLMYDNLTLGEQKETSGIASFGTLGCIVLLTLRPFRQRFYQAFFALQYVDGSGS